MPSNIKEVERTLSLSYPTVKGLLDELLCALSDREHSGSHTGSRASAAEILDMLEKGNHSGKGAEMLNELKTKN